MFLIASASFVLLFIFIRIIDDLSDAVRFGETFVLAQYLYDLPEIFVEISPVTAFLAGMFLLAEMLKYGELKILEISGISYRKIFYLLCICGLFISSVSFYMKNFTVPFCMQKKQGASEANIINFSSPGYFLYSEAFIRPDTFKNIHFSRTAEDNRFEVIKAETARYKKENIWEFHRGSAWILDSAGNLVDAETFVSKTYYIKLQPETLTASSQNIEALVYRDLKKLNANMKKLGIISSYMGSYLHERIAYPLLNLFLLFILLPFFSVKNKFSRIFVLSSSVILAFIAYGIYAFGFGLAVSGKVPPFLGVWMLHIVIFAALAAYSLRLRQVA